MYRRRKFDTIVFSIIVFGLMFVMVVSFIFPHLSVPLLVAWVIAICVCALLEPRFGGPKNLWRQ